jgi:hypothetical protein
VSAPRFSDNKPTSSSEAPDRHPTLLPQCPTSQVPPNAHTQRSKRGQTKREEKKERKRPARAPYHRGFQLFSAPRFLSSPERVGLAHQFGFHWLTLDMSRRSTMRAAAVARERRGEARQEEALRPQP